MFDFLVGNDLLSAVVAFGIVLIPAVLVHEIGHFVAGRHVGITILEFGIGFPPRIGKLFTWRETEFTLNMIPLGGFVRPLGEDLVGPSRNQDDANKIRAMRAEPDDESGDQNELQARGITNPTAVNDVKPPSRIYFLAAGALANFVFALIVFVLVGLLGVQQLVGVRVGIVELDASSPLATAGLEANDFIEKIDGEYFPSAAALFNRINAMRGQDITLQIRRLNRDSDEPDEIFSVTLPAFNAPNVEEDIGHGFVYITDVAPSSPAAVAGLQVGDLIFQFNDEALSDDVDPVARLQELTRQNLGSEITINLYRGGEAQTISLVPRVNPPEGEGAIGIAIRGQSVIVDGVEGMVIGQSAQSGLVSLPLGEAMSYGTNEFLGVFRQIVEFPVRLLQGGTEPEERRVVSVVGISQVGGEILQESVQEESGSNLLYYMALINIALGFTNLLPIPALDGGRILFVVIEMVRGKPIAPESEGIVHLLGLIFLLSIGVFFIINDIVNPLTDMIP